MKIVKLEYLGAVKKRADGRELAYGWADGNWTLVFTKAVLYQWFGVSERPAEKPTLYEVLGVKPDTNDADLRTAWKRAARTYHPDVCREADAASQFQAIQHAYELLKDPGKRARYDAGLRLEATLTAITKAAQAIVWEAVQVWRPPLRCGWLLVDGAQGWKFEVTQIHQWADILDAQGRALVTFWPAGADHFAEKWV